MWVCVRYLWACGRVRVCEEGGEVGCAPVLGDQSDVVEDERLAQGADELRYVQDRKGGGRGEELRYTRVPAGRFACVRRKSQRLTARASCSVGLGLALTGAPGAAEGVGSAERTAESGAPGHGDADELRGEPPEERRPEAVALDDPQREDRAWGRVDVPRLRVRRGGQGRGVPGRAGRSRGVRRERGDVLGRSGHFRQALDAGEGGWGRRGVRRTLLMALIL